MINSEAFFILLFVLAIACCVAIPVSEPKPAIDLSHNEVPFTLDLRENAGIKVVVEGQEQFLLILPYSDSLMFLNKSVAEQLQLQPIFFGLGVATFSDGDYSVSGKGFKASYSVGGAPEENIWALVMDSNIYEGYDGAISFGAIPADRIRLLLNDPPPGGWREVRKLSLSGKSKILESRRDYEALQFSKTLALYQRPITLNKKASYYFLRAGRAVWANEEIPLTRLFGNVRMHRPLAQQAPLILDGFQVDELLGETADEISLKGERPERFDPDVDLQIEDRVTVIHDKKSLRHAPVFYLGRQFFEGCSDMVFDKNDFLDGDQISVSVNCWKGSR